MTKAGCSHLLPLPITAVKVLFSLQGREKSDWCYPASRLRLTPSLIRAAFISRRWSLRMPSALRTPNPELVTRTFTGDLRALAGAHLDDALYGISWAYRLSRKAWSLAMRYCH